MLSMFRILLLVSRRAKAFFLSALSQCVQVIVTAVPETDTISMLSPITS